MPNYDKLRNDFQEKAIKIFQNNTVDYTPNDVAFMQGMNSMFGTAMSAKGLNVLDPIYANFFHYNKMGLLGNSDYPRVTRTYAFFTRPELNFSFENINAVPFFKWLYSKRIGKMIMASLTDPNYFINGPAALSNSNLSAKEINEIMQEFENAIAELDKTFDDDFESAGGTLSEEYKKIKNSEGEADITFTDMGFSPEAMPVSMSTGGESESMLGQDDPAEVERLQGLDFSSIYDMGWQESLEGNFTATQSAFNNYLVNYDAKINSLASKFGRAFNMQSGESIRELLRSRGLEMAKDIFKDNHNSPLDRYHFTSPFIPLLGNTCNSVTGAKDLNLNEFTYEEDEFGASVSVPTGMDEVWSGGSLSTSFSDIAYGPVSLMMMVWVLYIHYVSRGFISTTREHVIERILDYTCSIYVFVIGDDGRRIERWAKWTGCYPTTYPLMSQIEHNSNIDHDILQKISISWKYNRFEFMDPQIFTDFNFLSESEWLVKLRDPLWESLYNRHADLSRVNKAALDLTNAHTEEDRLFLNSINRPPELWEVVQKEDRGMSGLLPTALIEPMGNYIGGDSWVDKTPSQRHYYGSAIDAMNNYWGGYPYINKGTEFIWVLPQFGANEDVHRDRFNPDGTTTNPDTNNFNSDNRPEKNKTGFDQHHAVIKEVAEPDIDPTATYFIGNATVV